MLALLGGSFDPIHQGHLHIARYLQHQLLIPEIWFIPCKQPVIAKQVQATATQRLQMLAYAIQGETTWKIDTGEIDRKTPSYTQETLTSLREIFPTRSLIWVMGSDVFNSLDSLWGDNWYTLVEYAHILVIQRHSQSLLSPTLKAWLAQHQVDQFSYLQHQTAGFIYQVNIQAPHISSTMIRQAIKNGRYFEKLVPDAVLDYIQQQGLYCKFS